METAAVVWIVASAGGLLVLYLAWTFNRLVALKNRAEAAWSDIDVQLKRRWDLVPALVATVQGYARHESEALQSAVAARQQAVDARSIQARGEREQSLSQAVHGIFALAEAYPELKASDSFRDLHTSLVDIENHVQYARRYYNAVVRDFNTLRASFPVNLVAGLFAFREREFFQLADEERANPLVKL